MKTYLITLEKIKTNKNVMKVLLLNLPFIFEKKSDMILSHCLGILQIAGYLRENNHEVKVVDALQEGFSRQVKYENSYYKVGLADEEIFDRIDEGVDVLGISVPFSHAAKLAHDFIAKVKREFKDLKVVMGGVYPGSQPEMAVQSEADFVIMGEGEEPFLNILDYLNDKEVGLSNSIITQESDLKNAKSFYSSDINKFPLPARDLVNFNNYLVRSPRNVRGWKSASIITSKGCPFDCEFCAVHPVCGYKWRSYSAERVLEEIHYLVDNYGVDNIEIEDDNFTVNRERVKKILNGFIEINKTRNLSWQALNGLRIDTLDEELIGLFKDSNCRHLNIALEHGNEDVLKLIKKKLDLDKVMEIAKLVEKYKIGSHVFTIYGYPGESKERFNKALQYYKKLKQAAPNLIFKFFIAQPYPNTRLFDRCVKEGYLDADLFSDINKINKFSTANKVWIETPDFDFEEIKRRKKLLRKSLFTKQEYLMQSAREKLPDFMVNMLYSAYHQVGKIKNLTE